MASALEKKLKKIVHTHPRVRVAPHSPSPGPTCGPCSGRRPACSAR